MAGCLSGALAIVFWKEIAAVDGFAATRRLGYDCKWQAFAGARLAMPMQARICFTHSCESDLFQASKNQRTKPRRGVLHSSRYCCGFADLAIMSPTIARSQMEPVFV